jgi:hypothetical protein
MRDMPPASVHLIPIPIRPGLDAVVQVPFDLTVQEAEKIARVVVAIATGERR